MNFGEDEAERAFRLSLRSWLEVHGEPANDPPDDETRERYLAAWHNKLYRGGWLGLSWPAALGGRDLPDCYESIVDQELARANAPAKPAVVNYLGRALAAFGGKDLLSRYLPGLLNGTQRWCEGFSEPGAGSDLASLRTKATLDGDVYRVTGHKIWTSDASFADWCVVLARSEPALPKHKGISVFIVDMHAPGVTVKPIVQITGRKEFCEVFYDDVLVPRDHLVGVPGDGWPFAMLTLAYERGPGELGYVANFERTLRRLEGLCAAQLDPILSLKVAQAFVDVSVLRAQTSRALGLRKPGSIPGPEASLGKLLMTRVEQSLHHVALEAFGATALLGEEGMVLHDYLYSRAQSIMGGTEQIQKTIVAERLLNMPRVPTGTTSREG